MIISHLFSSQMYKTSLTILIVKVASGEQRKLKQSQERETLRNDQKEILEIKNRITGVKHIFHVLIINQIQPRKESMSFKTGQQELPKRNAARNK